MTVLASLTLADELATEQLANCIATQAALLENLSIHLHGDLGAGKTTLVRYLLRALGITGRIKSPTYALIEEYEAAETSLAIFHLDLYRLEDPQEWLDSGLHETIEGPGLKLVEWPDKAGELIAQPDWRLLLHRAAESDNTRTLSIQAHTPIGEKLLDAVLKCNS